MGANKKGGTSPLFGAPFLVTFGYGITAECSHERELHAAVFLRPFSVNGMERSVAL